MVRSFVAASSVRICGLIGPHQGPGTNVDCGSLVSRHLGIKDFGKCVQNLFKVICFNEEIEVACIFKFRNSIDYTARATVGVRNCKKRLQNPTP